MADPAPTIQPKSAGEVLGANIKIFPRAWKIFICSPKGNFTARPSDCAFKTVGFESVPPWRDSFLLGETHRPIPSGARLCRHRSRTSAMRTLSFGSTLRWSGIAPTVTARSSRGQLRDLKLFPDPLSCSIPLASKKQPHKADVFCL